MGLIRTKSAKVTLTLPVYLVEEATRFAGATQRDVQSVLADTLEMMWPTLGDLPASYPPVARLSDTEVLALAGSKMDPIQNKRLGQLQTKGKSVGLTTAERYELLALIQIYQLGQLRKSEGLAEAVKRGLQNPLSS